MKYILIFLCLITLIGCDKPMTNQEIIKAVQECKEAGLDSIASFQGLKPDIVKITCWGTLKENK